MGGALMLAGLLGAVGPSSGVGEAPRSLELLGGAFFPRPLPSEGEQEPAGAGAPPASGPRFSDCLGELATPADSDPAAWALDPVLKIPESLLDGMFGLARTLIPRPGAVDGEGDGRRPVLLRLADWGAFPRRSLLAADLASALVGREQRLFDVSEPIWLWTPPFDPGLEDALDEGDLRVEQRKVILDAVRKTYLARYRFRPEERIREDAFGFRGWSGPDFAVLPPLMAGYLCLRGLERRFSIGVLDLEVSLEPLSRWGGEHGDLPSIAGVGGRIRGFPLALLVSAGLRGGDVEVDFVGVGTSVGLVRRWLRYLCRD